MTVDRIYAELREAFRREVVAHDLLSESVSIRCAALSAVEAIGNPDEQDYPILKGKEVMVEARFKDARGQAFADEFESREYTIEELLSLPLDTNRQRASFVAGLNAVLNYVGFCDKTVHCKDKEPSECAKELSAVIPAGSKVLLVGHQPRFLEMLAEKYETRVVDLDEDNIGKTVRGVVIERAENTDDAIHWCDVIVATGSTLVNGTLPNFIDRDKPVVFFGVTISAAARILGLQQHCAKGH